MPGRSVDDRRIVGIGGVDPGQTIKERTLRFGGGRPEPPLPPDASSTLFVEGLPSDCTCREVSRILSLAIIFTLSFFFSIFPLSFIPSPQLIDIFRPFVGYKEVRLVHKESRHVSLFIYLF